MQWCLFSGRIFYFVHWCMYFIHGKVYILNMKLGRNMTVVRSPGKLSGSPPVASDQAIVTGVFIDFR